MQVGTPCTGRARSSTSGTLRRMWSATSLSWTACRPARTTAPRASSGTGCRPASSPGACGVLCNTPGFPTDLRPSLLSPHFFPGSQPFLPPTDLTLSLLPPDILTPLEWDVPYVLRGGMIAAPHACRRYVRNTLLAAAEERCALCTLSQVLAQQRLQRVDLLKIDVEGAELDVLRGVQPADWPRIQQVGRPCLPGMPNIARVWPTWPPCKVRFGHAQSAPMHACFCQSMAKCAALQWQVWPSRS